MQKSRTAFTLIELLVVISVIALLLAILMPALQKAKKLAQSAVCKAHLRQWGTVFFMYTTDNDNKFWTEHNVWATGVRQGNWMLMLAEMYGDVDKFRLCPSASKLNGPQGGIGTTFRQWGPGPIMEAHRFIEEPDKVYGSYGINLWMNSVDPPSTMGWRSQPERQWKTLESKYAADIPMAGDCTWFGTNPISIKDNSWPNGGEPAPSEDWWEQQDPINFGHWGYDMARFTINRHSRGINVTFMDGSARKVILHDLWSLKWHRGYERVHDIKIPWLR